MLTNTKVLTLALLTAESFKQQEIDEQVDALMYPELTSENFVTDVAEDLVYGVKGAFNFLKHVATLDMSEYYDSRMNTKYKRDSYTANRSIKSYGNKLDARMVELSGTDIEVAPLFATTLTPLAKIASTVLVEGIKPMIKNLDEFDMLIGGIISGTYKADLGAVKEVLKDSENRDAQQVIISKKIANLLGDDSTNTTVGNLVEDGNDLLSLGKHIVKGYDSFEERDVKQLLSSVKRISDRLEYVEEQIINGTLDKSTVDKIIKITVIYANEVSLVGKVVSLLTNTAKIFIAIEEEL